MGRFCSFSVARQIRAAPHLEGMKHDMRLGVEGKHVSYHLREALTYERYRR